MPTENAIFYTNSIYQTTQHTQGWKSNFRNIFQLGDKPTLCDATLENLAKQVHSVRHVERKPQNKDKD